MPESSTFHFGPVLPTSDSFGPQPNLVASDIRERALASDIGVNFLFLIIINSLYSIWHHSLFGLERLTVILLFAYYYYYFVPAWHSDAATINFVDSGNEIIGNRQSRN